MFLMRKEVEKRKPNADSLATYCTNNSLSDTECIKLLTEYIDRVSVKISEKAKNGSITNAPMITSSKSKE